MIVNGIVAEYNPLHQGHIYQMQDAKAHTGADYTIVVMSGNFVQRGAPAILDKYTRTRLALLAGADLVLELPVPYAVASAEYFALGSVSLLHKLGVVNNLCFGSECGDVNALSAVAHILSDEPESYKEYLQQYLKKGLSYPVARSNALTAYLKEQPPADIYAYPSKNPAGPVDLAEVLSSPNNILGVEYIKALLRCGSTIKPYTTQRMGSGYADPKLGTMSSALAVRQALFAEENLHATEDALQDLLAPSLPDFTCDALLQVRKQHALLCRNDFSGLLIYKLLTETSIGTDSYDSPHANKRFDTYLDVSSDLSDRICKQLEHFENFDGFCDLLKTKELTHTRISRALMHILLDIKKDTFTPYKNAGDVPYARVLGFKKESTPLLSAIKEKSTIPMITKLADAEKILDSSAFTLLQKEITMNQIYYSVLSGKSGNPMANEYRTPIVIL